ncbi:MAG: Uma2 family endonuclease, partial [Gemmatimonadota bacterium]
LRLQLRIRIDRGYTGRRSLPVELALITSRTLPPGNPSPSMTARRYNVERMALTQITWRDVQQLPDDGNRYEAIEGELYVTPAPSYRHQKISQRLEQALLRSLEEPGHGSVVDAPFGVEFPATGEGVQPDILFVSRALRGIIGDAGVRGAPDLVVEILSPTTAARDCGIKLRLYERQGVGEYWIVDPEAEEIEVWTFAEGPRAERFRDPLPVRLEGEAVGEIDRADIFRPKA